MDFFSKQSLNLYTLVTLQAIFAYKSILQIINRFNFQNIKDITEISIASENDDFTLFLGVFLPKKEYKIRSK